MTTTTLPSPNLVLFITTAAAFLSSFSASSVNVALPLIGSEYHLAGITLNWVVTAFVLTSAALIMPLGRLGDLYGRQLIFSLGMIVTLLGSLWSSLAPDVGWLIVARALTGIGSSMATGTVTAVLVAAFPPQERGRILGINVALIYLGISLGPALGGLITQAWGWRSLFWLHTALSVPVVLLIITRLGGNDRGNHGAFDLSGSLLYAAGLALLLLGVSGLTQNKGVGLLVGGLALLSGFLVFESKLTHPILPVTLFTKNREFAFSNLAAAISYSATFSVAFFLSLYLEVVRGMTPSVAGLVLLVQFLTQSLFSLFTGRMSDKISPRLLTSVGMGVTALGLAGLAFLDTETPILFILVALFLVGLGFALFSSPNTNSIMGSVEQHDLGLASATVATMRVLGQMVSMALALVLLSLFLGKAEVEPSTAQGFLAAQHWGFGVSAVLCSLGIVASLSRGPSKPA